MQIFVEEIQASTMPDAEGLGFSLKNQHSSPRRAIGKPQNVLAIHKLYIKTYFRIRKRDIRVRKTPFVVHRVGIF
jgi:hypothetical protein